MVKIVNCDLKCLAEECPDSPLVLKHKVAIPLDLQRLEVGQKGPVFWNGAYQIAYLLLCLPEKVLIVLDDSVGSDHCDQEKVVLV